MKKTYLILLFRWLIPGLLLAGFLVAPDVLHTASDSALASNWVARLFFAIYLMNPFVGAAKIIEKPELIEMENSKDQFYTPDEDSRRISEVFGTMFTILSTVLVFYFGLRIFFSIEGLSRFVLTILFAIVLGAITYYVPKGASVSRK